MSDEPHPRKSTGEQGVAPQSATRSESDFVWSLQPSICLEAAPPVADVWTLTFGNKMKISEQPTRFFGECLLLLLKVILFLFFAAVIYLLYDVAREGFSSSLGSMFESEPKEGWDYWRYKKIKENLPEWLLCGFVAISILGGCLWTIIREVAREAEPLIPQIKL